MRSVSPRIVAVRSDRSRCVLDDTQRRRAALELTSALAVLSVRPSRAGSWAGDRASSTKTGRSGEQPAARSPRPRPVAGGGPPFGDNAECRERQTVPRRSEGDKVALGIDGAGTVATHEQPCRWSPRPGDRRRGARPSWPPAGGRHRAARSGSAARCPPPSVATAVATTGLPSAAPGPARPRCRTQEAVHPAQSRSRQPASPPRADAGRLRVEAGAARDPASVSRPVTAATATTCRGAWPARCRASGCGSGPAPEREELPVAVVAQVEHARETDGGVGLLRPAPVRAWAPRASDAALDRRVPTSPAAISPSSAQAVWLGVLSRVAPVRRVASRSPRPRPSRRRRAAPTISQSTARAHRRIVGSARRRRSARTAPTRCRRCSWCPSGRTSCRPPPARAADRPCARAMHRIVRRHADLRQERDAARGDVGGRRIEQRAVIGERDVVEVVVRVVGSNAPQPPFAALHADDPFRARARSPPRMRRDRRSRCSSMPTTAVSSTSG